MPRQRNCFLPYAQLPQQPSYPQHVALLVAADPCRFKTLHRNDTGPLWRGYGLEHGTQTICSLHQRP